MLMSQHNHNDQIFIDWRHHEQRQRCIIYDFSHICTANTAEVDRCCDYTVCSLIFTFLLSSAKSMAEDDGGAISFAGFTQNYHTKTGIMSNI